MWQQFTFTFYLAGLCFMGLGCQKEYIAPELTGTVTAATEARKTPLTPCKEYYYLYGQEQIKLGEVNTTKINIGFAPAVNDAEKEQFVAEYSFLQGIASSYNTGSADATIVNLKPGLTCTQVEAALELLTKSGKVQYATPFFSSPVGNELLGITNQFILTLKSGYTRYDLQKLTKRTKTHIVEQLTEDTFIMSADKYATGNALQMANEFAGFYPVANSEPDFLYTY